MMITIVPVFRDLQIYQRINIRIVMTAIEIWTNGNRITTQGNPSTVLSSFIGYINREVKHKIPYDMAHFLANHTWPGIVGIANYNTMCRGAYGQTGVGMAKEDGCMRTT